MVEAANVELHQSKIKNRVTHLLGSALSLPFSEEKFDRIHAERLFQVLPKADANRVFSELDRVLKPEGRMVLVDTDWGSASVNHSDVELERKLIKFFATEMRPNGFAGRNLVELVTKHAYENVEVEVVPLSGEISR